MKDIEQGWVRWCRSDAARSHISGAPYREYVDDPKHLEGLPESRKGPLGFAPATSESAEDIEPKVWDGDYS